MEATVKNSKKKEIVNLDADERALLSSFERGELKSVKDVKKEKTRAKKVAANTLRKDIRINIRLSSSDISSIKEKAAYEGLPYQTLISSVLHKYAAGHLHHR